jgi:hypothetical protein
MGIWDNDEGGSRHSGATGIWAGRGHSGGGIWDHPNRDGVGIFSEGAKVAHEGNRAVGIWDPVDPWRKKVRNGW